MSFLRQLLPNSYDPGSVRTHRDMLSRTEAISAALAHAGLLTTDITDVIDDFHHRLLAALDSSERPAEVRAATDGILSRSIEEWNALVDALLMRRGTVKLFHRLPAVLSALEDAPLALWQAYRTLMESYLTHAWYPPEKAPRPNIYAATRHISQNPSAFEESCREVFDAFPHAGRVVFLEECVRLWKCLDRCEDIARREMAECSTDSWEYWDYRNVLRLAQTATRLDGQKLSVSLSGGNSNGLAHLGALERLASADGTLADSVGLVAGTSMGGIMAVLSSVAPIPDIQRDIVDGFTLDGRSYRLDGHTTDARDRERIMEFFLALGRKYGIDEGTRFCDLPMPVIVAASRDLPRGAQKILLGGDDLVIDALRAASNFRSPLSDKPLFGDTRVDGTLLTDDAANEEGNAIDTLERLVQSYGLMVAIDVGYSSERHDTPVTHGERAKIRRIFKLATTRDALWKTTLALAGGQVLDMDTTPSANMRGERFSPTSSERLFEI